MKKLDLNNLMNKILIVFLLIQPVFDVKFFYNSISTLIRVVIIFTLFLYYFFNSKNKRKYWLLAYPVLLGIYFVIHHLNSLSFNSLVPGNFNYSLLSEALYFVKMLSPILLVYCIYKASLSNDTIIGVIKSLCMTVSLVIVVSNLFKFSYGNYSDIIIKANFFEWFNPASQYTYQDLASKGLFEVGNQISAILIMFLPFMIYLFFYKYNFINTTALILNILALILLCTKVSVLGVLIVFVYSLFAYVLITFIQKKQLKIKPYFPIIIVLCFYILLLPVNPMFSRISERKSITTTFNEKTENTAYEDTNTLVESTITDDTSNEDVSNNYMIEYIENNYESKQLHKEFLFNYYPYKYDPEFWYDFLQNDISLTTNYRYIELSMIRRVVYLNNNKMDKWFGITNTRLQNIFNIEKDFVVQYYALGIIGTILVFAPYFIILISFGYKALRTLFKNLNIINLLAGITAVFLLGIAYFSGNLLNGLGFTIYYALCIGLLINNY